MLRVESESINGIVVSLDADRGSGAGFVAQVDEAECVIV